MNSSPTMSTARSGPTKRPTNARSRLTTRDAFLRESNFWCPIGVSLPPPESRVLSDTARLSSDTRQHLPLWHAAYRPESRSAVVRISHKDIVVIDPGHGGFSGSGGVNHFCKRAVVPDEAGPLTVGAVIVRAC